MIYLVTNSVPSRMCIVDGHCASQPKGNSHYDVLQVGDTELSLHLQETSYISIILVSEDYIRLDINVYGSDQPFYYICTI